MSDKSLIFSMFSKFLDNGGEDEQDEREVRPQTDDSKMEAGRDQRIETVEDWNDAERTRRERLERELTGENGSEETEYTAGTEAEADGLGVKDSGGSDYIGSDYGSSGSLGGRMSRSSLENGSTAESRKASGEEEYRDAGVELTVSDDRMAVSLMLIEPSGGGSDITREQIEQELEAHRIIHGIDEEKVNTIAAEKLYRQMFLIARGTPAIDGNDGRIKDYFPREAKIKYASKGNGGIDFKSMNLIHNVQKGELVCELTMPTEPQDGVDVFGQPVRGKNGTMPPIPQGKNVVYSPERDKLLTACEGNLTFRNGRFQVENVFVVSGNVDNSIGNIDFTGSVTIHGDVFEGYTVKAKGDITVMGIVEGAVLQAGGSILLHKGMRGMKSGVLEAGTDITAKFLEDCTIYAQHNIQAEYIINSEVSCGHDLTLIGKRGAFIAGSCAVHNCMNVKTVGASSHVSTIVTLGVTPQLMEEVEKISVDLVAVSRKQAETAKDISYLNGKLKDGSITPRQKERLAKLKLEALIHNLKEKRLKTQAADLARQLREVGKCRLTAAEVHPGTVINIGDCKMTIVKREESCSFYYLDGEIRKGIR